MVDKKAVIKWSEAIEGQMQSIIRFAKVDNFSNVGHIVKEMPRLLAELEAALK
jgi:hypothetical protein